MKKLLAILSNVIGNRGEQTSVIGRQENN